MTVKDLPDTKPIEQLVERIGAEAVFGTPTTENGVTVIPVAQVEFGFGYGGGYGRSGRKSDANDQGEDNEMNEEETESETTGDEGGGGGGGAGGRATPRGFIRITSDKVKYESIMDELRIPIAGILMVAWSVFWITATIRAFAKASVRKKEIEMRMAK
ncbi:hypothetical protein KFU94_04495 [Chloroflexi bacterium TSY]|nr:hypothetical protein [Chloroflexi bacterium TSY]